MSDDVQGLIGWLRSWFDSIYALKSEIPEGATVDTSLSTSSNNPVRNSAITTALNNLRDGKANTNHNHNIEDINSETEGGNSLWNIEHFDDDSGYAELLNGLIMYDKDNDIVMYQQDEIATNGQIPLKTSDLTNDSGFLTSHQTVNSWTTVSSGVTGLTLYVNSALRIAMGRFYKASVSYSAANTYYSQGTITSGYRPKLDIYMSTNQQNVWGTITSAGLVQFARSASGTANTGGYAVWCY